MARAEISREAMVEVLGEGLVAAMEIEAEAAYADDMSTSRKIGTDHFFVTKLGPTLPLSYRCTRPEPQEPAPTGGPRDLHRRCKECGRIGLMTVMPDRNICDDCA